jgi:dethiobiotin synthetase
MSETDQIVANSIFFVTGTDTDVGKTFISSALLRIAGEQFSSRVGIKPIAAGCELVDGELRNGDALELMAAADSRQSYVDINPVALAPAIAPHIALMQADRTVSVKQLAEHCRGIADGFEFSLVEGAGGWFVPLNDQETLADLCVALNAEIILVIGMKLGCLNHALLTELAISQSGLKLAGWVANTVAEKMPFLDENLATLEARLNAPCLGKVPFLDDGPEAAKDYLTLGPLLPRPPKKD